MKELRSFIYGRKNVLSDSERGYYVFLKTPGFPYQTIDEIVNIFSTDDPGAFTLQQMHEFFVHFPLRKGADGQWLFGKGTVEHRGKYYSYILHGVLLNNQERAELSHNPFLLADQLNPHIGNNRKELPCVVMPRKKAYHTVIIENFNNFPEKDRWRLVRAAGMFVTGRMKPAVTPVFPYHFELKADLWRLVFALIPEEFREQTSLCTFFQFLKGPVKNDLEIVGILQSDWEDELRKKENYAVLPQHPGQLAQTSLGDFLWDFLQPAEVSEDEKKERLEFYEDATAHAKDFQTLETILETVKKPSVASLRHLKEWPAQIARKWKEKHFDEVWKRNRSDMEPVDFFYEMGTDFFAYSKDSDNMSEKFVTTLVNRLLTNDDDRMEAFFDEILGSHKQEMIKPILCILYHKIAFLWIRRSERHGPDMGSREDKGIRKIITLIRRYYDRNPHAYPKVMKDIIHQRFMEFTIEPLARKDRVLLRKNKEIYESYFDKHNDSLANIRLTIMDRCINGGGAH